MEPAQTIIAHLCSHSDNDSNHLWLHQVDPMDILKLLQDHDIEHTTEHQHCTRDSVNIHCPFCPGSQNYHLGIKLDGSAANCWRCGGHSVAKVFSKILHLSFGKAKTLLEDHSERLVPRPQRKRKDNRPTRLLMPLSNKILPDRHKKYLEQRGFDTNQIEKDYHIKGTGPVGEYKHRIIIPLYMNGRIISFQGRDITGKAKAKYKNCPETLQIYPAKHWLYNLDRCSDLSRVIVVEGPTDVWRLGKGAVATMGIQWTMEQAALLTRFKTVFLLFDPEDQAQEQARKLMDAVGLVGVDTEVILLKDAADPGSMGLEEALKLKRWLGIGG